MHFLWKEANSEVDHEKKNKNNFYVEKISKTRFLETTFSVSLIVLLPCTSSSHEIIKTGKKKKKRSFEINFLEPSIVELVTNRTFSDNFDVM